MYINKYIMTVNAIDKANPGQGQRFPGGRGSKNARQSAHECCKFVRPTHRPTLPIPLLIPARG